ncbi:hypothetical protein BDP27DRAFT_1363431 [Rhodocollybia butyracea]|uniref:Uncharacterized protein n=1 Tax=Rhodocollybia butyracea TaxID=206335 RepID=A0A9P5U7X2_9AGAR|nr:hypothetical protein BDP27DRAFT_1363431 [Rhodocollybia butyracea]
MSRFGNISSATSKIMIRALVGVRSSQRPEKCDEILEKYLDYTAKDLWSRIDHPLEFIVVATFTSVLAAPIVGLPINIIGYDVAGNNVCEIKTTIEKAMVEPVSCRGPITKGTFKEDFDGHCRFLLFETKLEGDQEIPVRTKIFSGFRRQTTSWTLKPAAESLLECRPLATPDFAAGIAALNSNRTSGLMTQLLPSWMWKGSHEYQYF